MHAQQQQLINGAWVAGDADPLSKHDPVSVSCYGRQQRPAQSRSRPLSKEPATHLLVGRVRPLLSAKCLLSDLLRY